MLDRILDFVVVLLPLVIAIMSVLVGIKLAKNPQDETHKIWWWGIIALGVICSGVTFWQQDRARNSHARELKEQTDAVNGLRSDLQQAETSRQVDEAYIKAKIEDYAQLKSFADAVKGFAQTNAEYTKRQFQSVALSNKQLRAKTLEVIGKLRDFEATRRQASELINQKYLALNAADKSGTNQANFRLQEMHEEIMDTNSRDGYFHEFILPDAVYVRNELLKRGAKEPPLSPRQQSSLIVFEGVLAGPDPGLEAADYLDELLKQLYP